MKVDYDSLNQTLKVTFDIPLNSLTLTGESAFEEYLVFKLLSFQPESEWASLLKVEVLIKRVKRIITSYSLDRKIEIPIVAILRYLVGIGLCPKISWFYSIEANIDDLESEIVIHTWNEVYDFSIYVDANDESIVVTKSPIKKDSELKGETTEFKTLDLFRKKFEKFASH